MRLATKAAFAALLLTGTAAHAQTLAAVQSSALRPLDAWQTGQVPSGDAELPASLWKNSDAAAIGPLMDTLKAPFPSPAATRLARAAMLSGGDAPAGSEAAAGEAARKRFAALGRFGAADEIVAMANVAPEATSDPNILTFATQADLARGRPADACRRAQGSAATPYILRLRAFCFATNGDQAPTDLAIEVARQAGVNDFWLFSALPAIYGDRKGPAARFDSSLDAAVSIAGKLKLGPRPLLNASLLAKDVVARDQDSPPALRAEAAIDALTGYAISPDVARDALAPALATKSAKGLPAFVTDLQRVSAAETPAAKAQALVALYKRTPTYAEFVAAARLTREEIASLPRDETTAPSALWLARAALAIGDVKLAAAWREGLAQGAPGADEKAALDVAIAAAGGGGADAALRRRVELGGANAARDAALFGALGSPPTPQAAALIASAPQPKGYKNADATTVAALVAASQRGAQGETALYAAKVIAPGAHLIDRASLVSTLQALRAVGLEGLARQVAVEAMIGGGIR
jgi:hypothetical protein